MRDFVYRGLPSRVVFGAGVRRQLRAEVERLGMWRVLVLTTPRHTQRQLEGAAELRAQLGDLWAGTFDGAALHTPLTVTEVALERMRQLEADGLVALGGGSVIGLGKALALRTAAPQVAIPTTYAGSEMTPILGQTEGGRKTTLRDPRVLPQTVIYDVELTLSLPPGVSGTSGINAAAHAVEALYAPDANPLTSLLALEGIAVLGRALPRVVQQGWNLEARGEALYGAWLCATCLAHSSMGLHHKLCHTLGGALGLPHSETHTAVLPHAAAYNAAAVPEVMRGIARALGAENAPQALYDLGVSVGAKMALRDLGMPHGGLERALDLAFETPYPSPRPLERDGIRALLERAWAGERPETP